MPRPASDSSSDWMRENGLKLLRRGFRLDIRKHFHSGRVVRQWHRLPREVMGLLSLEVLQKHGNMALRGMVMSTDWLDIGPNGLSDLFQP